MPACQAVCAAGHSLHLRRNTGLETRVVLIYDYCIYCCLVILQPDLTKVNCN